MNHPEKLSKRQWLDLHHSPHYLSASQCAAALGFDQYIRPITLYAQKIGAEPWPEETLAMRRGHRMEQFVALEFKEATGHKIQNPGDYTTYTNHQTPWLFATPDRLLFTDSSVGVLECKAPSRKTDWTEEDAPLQYQIQLQIQLHCTGLDWGFLAAVIGNELLYYRYEKNEEFINQALDGLREFQACCQEKREPQIDHYERARKSLERLHPDDNGERIQLTEDMLEIAKQYEFLKTQITNLENERDLAGNKLRQYIGGNTYAESSECTYSLKTQGRKGVLSVDPSEAAKLRALNIEYKETQPSTFRVLRKVK